MTLRLRFAAAVAALLLGVPLSPLSALAVDCSIASQRDATCVGSLDAYGTHPTDNALALAGTTSTRPANMTMGPRGANALVQAAVSFPAQTEANTCVTVPFISWAYDPVSFGTAAPSFISPAGSGYIGSGGSSSPTSPCPSDADGSCTTWVPADHPYLFLGSQGYAKCTGTASQGSVSCSISSGSAYMTNNPTAGWNFSAYMIACTSNNSATAMSILGVAATNWQPSSSSPSFHFYYIYPAENTGGN